MHRKLLLLPLVLAFTLLFWSVGANAQCTISATPSNAFVCKGETELYSVSSTVSGTTYSWSMSPMIGTPSSPTGPNVSIFWHTTGTTTVTVTASNSLGTTTCSMVVNVGAIPQPTITASSQVGCQTLPPPREQNDPPQFDDGCIKACEGSWVTYTANGPVTSGYNWVATGGTAYPSGNTCTVHWGAAGQGSLTVTETTNPNGCSGSKQICIEIIPKPHADFGALPDTTLDNITVCLNDTIQFVQNSYPTGTSPLINWYWNFGDGTTFSSSTPTNPSHHYTSPGGYEVYLVVKNACNCTDTTWMRIEVRDGEGVKFLCFGAVCEKDKASYSVDLSSITCSGFPWSVIGGTISGGTTSTVDVVWDNVDTSGFGYVSYDGNYCSGPNHCPSISTIKVPVIQQAGHISGLDIVCLNSNTLYRLPAWPGVKFNWSVSGPATISPTDQPNEILVHTFGASGTVYLHCDYIHTILGCKGKADKAIQILPAATISSTYNVACIGTAGTYNLVGASSGTWVVTPPGSAPLPPVTGPSVTVNYTQVGVYTVSVSGTTFCAPEPFTTTVYPRPSRPNTITGPDTICSGNTYTFSAGAAQTGTVFVWSIISGGATFVGSPSGANVSILFNGPGPWTIGVRRMMMASPNCESGNITKTVYPPQVNVVVDGEDQPCPNSYEMYTAGYLMGETYEWGVTSNQGSISSGDGTPTATVLWNNTSGPAQVWVRIRKCARYYTDTFDVNVGALPTLTLTQSAGQVCRDAPFSLTLTNTGSIAFTSGTITWDFGDGSTATSNITSTTTTIIVPHPYTALNQTVFTYPITVTITNVNGCPGATLIYNTSVNVLPAPVAWVTPLGPVGLCNPSIWPDLTANLQTGFVATDEFKWFSTANPLVSISNCFASASFPCNPLTVPGYGSYYVVAIEPTNGCADTSNIVSIYNNCGGGGCAIMPTPVVTATGGPADCGNVSLTGTFSSPGYSPSWNSPSIATNVVPGTNTLTANIGTAGVYDFTYTVLYNDASNQPCGMNATAQVLVPLIPRVLTSLNCKSDNSGYVLTLYDVSSQYPSVTINSRNFIVDNTLVQSGPGNTFSTNTLSPGPHTIALEMVYSYTWNSVTYTNVVCTTAVQTINVPSLPHASFIPNTPSNNCVEVAVGFTSNSAPTGLYHAWLFGDGTGIVGIDNPQREYLFPGIKPVALTVTDQFGCTDDTVVSISVTTNPLGLTTLLTPANICEGSSASLSYGSGGLPVTYNWMNGTVNFFSTTTNGIGVSDNGSYWVHVIDANHCFAYTQAMPLSVTSVPEPVINGSTTQCEGTAFTLDGFAGPGPGITYSWTENMLSFPGSNQPSITRTRPPGTYTYILTLTVGGCQRVSAPYVVTVYPPPPPPVLAFNVIDCPTYEIELTAATGPGNVAWSHGTTGTPTTAWVGGLYKAWYTDLNGCVSSDSINVPKDPAGYLWVFPTGCYTKCPNPTFTIYGPIIPFEYWNFMNGSTVISSGGPGYVTPLTISTGGLYSMTLKNPYCAATIGTLDLTVPDDCNKPCEKAGEAFVDGVHYNWACNAFVDFGIFNPYGVPVTVQIVSAMPSGTMSPSSFVLNPGFNYPISSQWIPTVPFPGGQVQFTLLYTLPDGSTCSQQLYTHIECPFGGTVYRQAAPGTTPEASSIVSSGPQVLIVPNPAQDATTVQYSFGSPAAKRTLQVYDVAGRLMATLDSADNAGTWPIKLDSWAAGLYQVVLKADGKVIAHSKLSVTH